jgi:hypothetical protein
LSRKSGGKEQVLNQASKALPSGAAQAKCRRELPRPKPTGICFLKAVEI